MAPRRGGRTSTGCSRACCPRAPTCPSAYASALAQRNAALRRVAAGVSGADALEPWTEQVVELAEALVDARRQVVALLAPAFAERAAELGLVGGTVAYEGEPPTRAALDERLARDLERGTTGLGPHLDDVRLLAGDRDLRTFGSQGEQRMAVLSLLLAEAGVLTDQGGIPPLLLLDDALSELDAERRRLLSTRLGSVGQTLVTATGAEALPLAPAQLLAVTPGRVEAVA